MNNPISRQALRRMPGYVLALEEMRGEGVEYVSAPVLAKKFGLNEEQVRKDLSSVSSVRGKPRAGFPVAALLKDMREFLGYDNVDDAVLVGAGSLGHALLNYQGFDGYGVRIIAAFDIRAMGEVGGKSVLPMEKLGNVCRRLGVKIGILTVPAQAAQAAADQLVEAGILAIWNFAPVVLRVPEHILVQNENMANSLVVLSMHLREQLRREEARR